MRYILILIILISALIDTCPSREESSAPSAGVSSTVQASFVEAAHDMFGCQGKDTHSSSQSSNLHRCHLGHCGLIAKINDELLVSDTALVKTGYRFGLNSPYALIIRRPPKANI